MRQGLKQKVESLKIEIRDHENQLRQKWTFQWSSYFEIIIDDKIGKEMGCKKEHNGYVLCQISTNWDSTYVEEELSRMVEKFNKMYWNREFCKPVRLAETVL